MNLLYSLYFLTLLCIGFSFNVRADTFTSLQDFQSLKEEVNQLKEIVGYQQNQLKRYQKTEWQKEDRLRVLESKLTSLQQTCQNKQHHGKNGSSSQKPINRSERQLTDFQSLPSASSSDGNIIAFYAMMSQTEVSPGAHHTLIFDDAKTNEGGAYSPNTGTFTAPQDGFYVFVWKIRIHTAEHSTELVVNQDVYGATFLRAKNGDDGSVTDTVVVHLSKGDEVFVRTHSTYAGDGSIISNIHSHPSFSGWKLN